jgi:hypothetical protein
MASTEMPSRLFPDVHAALEDILASDGYGCLYRAPGMSAQTNWSSAIGAPATSTGPLD